MGKYVNLSERVTATFYDEQNEEWTQQTVTVADVLDSVCDDYMVVELPEIIRCRDCKHVSLNGVYGCRFEPFDTLKRGERMYPDDFCSRAERREE